MRQSAVLKLGACVNQLFLKTMQKRQQSDLETMCMLQSTDLETMRMRQSLIWKLCAIAHVSIN